MVLKPAAAAHPPHTAQQTPSWETKALNKEAQGVVKGAQEVVKSTFSRASLTGTTRSIKPGPVRTVCENTCPTARDGVCQDGRPGPGSNYASDATAGGQNTFVTFTVVPEPSTALLGGIGMLLLFRRRRG